MKPVLFGCKDTTLHAAKYFNAIGISPILVTISKEKGLQQEVAGYVDLSNFSNLFDQIYIAERYDLRGERDHSFFKSNEFEIGIAIGWQRLVPQNILSEFSVGVFGMHGSAQNLPFGKGRSPMNWSLIEGRKWFYTNLFKYDAGVDNGPIVDTECFSINESDTAETLHYKNTLSLINLLKINWKGLIENSFALTPQKEGNGSFYPKRTPADGLIDWADSIFNIERLIRAVSPPFYGAFGRINRIEVIIDRAGIFYTDLERHQFADHPYGEVCDVFPNGKFLVRCNGGVLIVHSFRSTLSVIDVGLKFDDISDADSKFSRNKYGFFDL